MKLNLGSYNQHHFYSFGFLFSFRVDCTVVEDHHGSHLLSPTGLAADHRASAVTCASDCGLCDCNWGGMLSLPTASCLFESCFKQEGSAQLGLRAVLEGSVAEETQG